MCILIYNISKENDLIKSKKYCQFYLTSTKTYKHTVTDIFQSWSFS